MRALPRRSLPLCALAALTALAGCDDRTPRDDYDDFRDRTAAARESACTAGGGQSGVLADVEGRWLLNALLKGGIRVGLRIVFEAAEGSTDTPAQDLDARIWLHDQPLDAEPLVVTTTTVADDGTFELVADPLDLGTDVLESEASVIAVVTMLSRILDGERWCGDATGSVTSPLTLALDGSTFYAQRDDGGALVLDELPFECPGDPCAPDAGVPDAGPPDAGVDGGPTRPETPDLSDVPSARRDLSGEYILTASLRGLVTARLWLSVIYREHVGDDGAVQAALDGTLRAVTDPPGSPPAATFFTPVDPEGRFEIWLPDFALEIGGLDVQGDILLAAASLEDRFCGAVAGEARSPIMLDLAGSTFSAMPWTPGTEPPMDPPNACPGEDPPEDAPAE